MTKTVTISDNRNTKQVELHDPGEKQRERHLIAGPNTLKMSPKHLAWLNSANSKGSELDMDEVADLSVSMGYSLFTEVTDYWMELRNGNTNSDTNKIEDELGDTDDEEKEFSGIELDDQGAVDLEDMQ